MSVKKEASGRRSIEIEFEVPGTPEEVWKAIATGPGISSWLMPAEFEEREGKPVALTLKWGPGMEPRSEVTAWDPPRMFATQADGMTPEAPPFATEWTVEARGGGKCVCRIVQSLFASTDEWDDQLESATTVWGGFLRTLLIYLTHFRGQSSTIMKWMAPAEGTEAEAWNKLLSDIGLKGASVGQRWKSPEGVPAFSGVVEYLTENPYDALLRIEEPGPGVAALGTFSMGGPSIVAMNFYLYGDQGDEIVALESPRWDAWFQENFPAPAEAIGSE